MLSCAALLAGLLRALRPHQWIKNLFVLAPLVFARELLDPPMALRAAAAFGLFCLAASSVYLVNDLLDVQADRAHPVKRMRPIASGRVPLPVARTAAALLAIAALGGGWLLGPAFAATVLGYLVLNVAYSTLLKRIPYVDVLCITAGFELRVLAGALAARVPASGYLLIATALLATFLGFGKRAHELSAARGAEGHGASSRSVLARYSPRALRILLASTATATVATYVVYTLDPATRAAFGTDWLVVTAIPGLFGVLRFVHLVRHRPRAESPTEEMLRDPPFLANLVLWVVAVVIVIYAGRF
ncbi:MAG: decaprenyl-phosphate phosphoribosyltransferase [Myxococcota bacterium]|nr:decaprenyl-phosphate phosphoribosyltransferase [Myxococcota bacterium]MDW8362372.1 decaprenyl-phosphate phosphoribosyltransferase [Myxococcales bacterium]